MSEHDVLRRFIFEDLDIRGLWVDLGDSWQTAKQYQHCPKNVQGQLGQALAAVVLLSATIKFKGHMILQAQGDGPIKTLVAQATDAKKIRGLIRSGEVASTHSLQEMFGEGRLVITLDSDLAPPYQGIVPLNGENLASALETYFVQSEQLNTRLWLFADESRATGLLLQQLPSKLANGDDWERIQLLAGTITEQEMLQLDCETILHRLFNQEQVRVFEAEAVAFECSCSRPKIAYVLRQLGRQELETVVQERGQVEVNCEFCGQQYRFDKIDVEQLLLRDNNAPPQSQARH